MHVASRYRYTYNYALFKYCYDIGEPLLSNNVMGNTLYNDDEWANNYVLLRLRVVLCNFEKIDLYGNDLLHFHSEHCLSAVMVALCKMSNRVDWG